MGTSSTIPTKELSVRQVAYLYLLTVDVYLGEILRDTAAEAGDYAAGARDYYEIPSEILEVTKEYLARWPKLAGARAERAPQ